jgi:hypothetical protein
MCETSLVKSYMYPPPSPPTPNPLPSATAGFRSTFAKRWRPEGFIHAIGFIRLRLSVVYVKLDLITLTSCTVIFLQRGSEPLYSLEFRKIPQKSRLATQKEGCSRALQRFIHRTQ